MKNFIILPFLMMSILLASCETMRHPSTKKVTKKTRVLETKTLEGVSQPSSGRFVQEGVASWYGPNFHKKRTANGEIYDMYGITAAHKTVPFNVYLKVTNLDNDKSVVVRVNDRGPFVKDRIIDLTYTAAYQIGMLDKGTAPVRIEGLGYIKEVDGKRTYISPASYEIEGTLTLQVGSFKSKENAESLAEQLRTSFPDVHTTELEIKGEKYYRVLAGKYQTPEEAENDLNRLIKSGFAGAHLLTE